MQDLATAFIKVLGNEKASKEVFNISGEKYVTFDGLAKACAKVMTVDKFVGGQKICDVLKLKSVICFFFC